MEEFTLLEQNLVGIDSLGELYVQYRRDLRERAGVRKTELHKTMLYIGDDFTTCGCGKILLSSERVCPDCGANIVDLENTSNKSILIDNLVKHNEKVGYYNEGPRNIVFKRN